MLNRYFDCQKCLSNEKNDMQKTIAKAVVFICFFVLYGDSFVFSANGQQAFTYRKTTEKILRLKEVIRIQDTSGAFYFKYPSTVSVDSLDNVYVLDSSRILQFDSKGNYLRNFLKKGEGPGEVSWVSSFCVTGNSIIAFNSRPPKIIRFTTGGEFVEEFRFKRQTYMTLVYSIGDVHFFMGQPMLKDFPNGYVDVPHEFFTVSGKGKKINTLFSIPVKMYLVGEKGARGSFDVAELHFVFSQERYLILAHTERYGIEIYDLTTGKIVREFSRKYQKKEIPSHLRDRFSRGMVTLNGTGYKKPPPEYFNDIRGLLVFKGKIWVVTSTVDEKKGVLIDVFDFEGKYSDAFYLRLGERTDYYLPNWYVHGDFLYTIEQPPDDDPLVVKYKIEYR